MKSSDTDTRFHHLQDGRILAYSEYGDPLGQAMFYAHGTPGSRLEGRIFHPGAADHGFRLIAVDRPGIGLSSPHPAGTFIDYAGDIASLAAALNLDQFGLIGWSGGGAPTLTCANILHEHISFTIILAGYTNFSELPHAAQYLETRADQIAVTLAQHSSLLFDLAFWLLAASINYLPRTFYRTLLQSIYVSGQQVLSNPDIKSIFLADQQEAVRQGWHGIARDSLLQYADWGFQINDIPGKVIIFHGEQDRMVPMKFSRHLMEHLQQGELHTLPDQGHFFPIPYQDEIFRKAREVLAAR